MKKAFLIVIVGIIGLASVATTARAQDKGQLGFTAAVGVGSGEGGGAIGVQYHLSKSVALRPSFGYSRSKMDGAFYSSGVGDPAMMPPIPANGLTSTQWSAELAGLFFLTRKEGLSTYLGASAAYFKATQDLDFVPLGSGMGASLAQKNDAAVARAFFGMQYAVAKRFGLYGELGVRYYDRGGDRSLNSSGFSTFGAGLGAIFYVK